MEKLQPDTFKEQWIRPETDDQITIHACGNESESFQIVIIPFKSLQNITWKVEGGTEGIHASVSPVGFVNVKKPMDHRWVKNYPLEEDNDPGYWPDPIYSTWNSLKTIDSGRIQPLWVTLDIPPGAKAGTYPLKIKVSSENSHSAEISVTLKIWNFTLPDRIHLKTCFYFEDPYIGQYYPEIKGDNLLELKKKYWKMALDCRINPTDVYFFTPDKMDIVFDKETGKYTFTFLPGMNERLSFILEKNGRKSNLITVTNSGNFEYGSFPSIKPKVDFTGDKIFSDAYRDFLRQYLGAWKKYLGERNWTQFGSMLLADEPGKHLYKVLRHLIPIVKGVVPEWPVYGAVNFQPAAVELQNVTDILVPGFASNFNSANLPFYEKQIKDGKEVWGYVCAKSSCINFQPIDHRMLFWQCWNYKFTGFLYWGTINWFQSGAPAKYPAFFGSSPEKRWPNAANPEWKNASFDNGAPGDGYLIYPSPEGPPWSSIRLENFRDGIEDYEYFHILNEQLEALKKDKAGRADLLKEAGELLNLKGTFIKAPMDYNRNFQEMLERRIEVGNMIERIANIK